MMVFPGKHIQETLHGFIEKLLCFVLSLLLFFSSSFCFCGEVNAADHVKVEVTVTGIDGELKENILKLLEIYRERNNPDLTAGRIFFLHGRAVRDIKNALEPFGYFRPRIAASLDPPERPGQPWKASYHVEKGPRIRIGSVKFLLSGPGRDAECFRIPIPFKKGSELDQQEYEDFKKKLIDAAAANGFLDARFITHRIVVDLESYRADIVLKLDTGPRYYFGPITFSGTDLSPDFLLRFLEIKNGEVFNQEKLVEFKSRLLDSRYFKSVTINPRRDLAGNDRHIPINVIVNMNKPNVYRMGAGYASDSGPRLTLDWKRRYLGKHGHKARAEIQYSPKDSYIEGEYTIPLEQPRSEYLSFKPGIERYDTDSRDGWHYTAKFTHSVVTDSGWRRNIGFDLGYETYNVGDDSSSTGEFIPKVSCDETVSDNIVFTRRGYMIRRGLSGAIEGLLADTSYIASRLRTKWIRSISDDYRFISRMDLGAVMTSNVRDLPGSARFFTGGGTSIRGYAFEELGPIDRESGDVLGGRYLAVGSVEIERHIYDKWLAALFCDMGNSFDPELSNSIKVGTGFGIRWRSPLGLVRLDFGFGVSESPVPFKFYLSVGPDF